jgi:hypothetical protein
MNAGTKVRVEDQVLQVKKTSSQRLKTLSFQLDGREYQAIEQNPEKPSRWGELARKGHHVVQFRDVASGKYVAVAIDGEIKEYGKLGKKTPQSHSAVASCSRPFMLRALIPYDSIYRDRLPRRRSSAKIP